MLLLLLFMWFVTVPTFHLSIHYSYTVGAVFAKIQSNCCDWPQRYWIWTGFHSIVVIAYAIIEHDAKNALHTCLTLRWSSPKILYPLKYFTINLFLHRLENRTWPISIPAYTHMWVAPSTTVPRTPTKVLNTSASCIFLYLYCSVWR